MPLPLLALLFLHLYPFFTSLHSLLFRARATEPLSTTLAAFTSSGIRIAALCFLRMVAVPPLLNTIYTLFAIYTTTFISSWGKECKSSSGGQVDVDVKDQRAILPKKKRTSWQSTLLRGTPTSSSLFTILTFLVNLVCVAMVTDLAFSPRWFHQSHDLSFARVGYVSDTEAKLLLREPDQSKLPVTVQYHIKDPQPPFDDPTWQTAGNVHLTTEDSDYTAVVTIPLLNSNQRVYQWTTSNNHSGEFVSAPKPGATPELFDGKFTFLSTSCIIPRLPYNPFDHPLSFPGMKHLAKVLPDLGAQFMLFLGDFIYIDVPRQFGQSVEHYRQKYRQVYASPDWPAIGQNLSWIHVLDDHEIRNDWDTQKTGVYETAVDPWHHYQTAVNPPEAMRADRAGLLPRSGASYFAFTQGPASFFMLDTRSYRSKNSEPFESENKTMLGDTQLADFIAWLHRPEPKGVKWKVVASSVPFTKNWRVNTRDTWGGFLVERRKVLEAMWDASAKGVGVVVLSGDRHEFGATAFPPPKHGKWSENATVHEFSASPLNQFFSPIGTYTQTDDEDVKLAYINRGNSKFGVITIEKTPTEQSSLHYTVYIDGVNAWNTTILSPFVAEPENVIKAQASSFWDRIRGV
ncbi:PhoD-like phosphatase [Xylariaceae sp. FL1272]|nr:PhoD-like phosphatase [Xylariaceae sp. FL1272]